MIKHAFLKPSLVNLISKDVNLVFYLSVNSWFTLQTVIMDYSYRFLCQFNFIDNMQKVHYHVDLIKIHVVR